MQHNLHIFLVFEFVSLMCVAMEYSFGSTSEVTGPSASGISTVFSSTVDEFGSKETPNITSTCSSILTSLFLLQELEESLLGCNMEDSSKVTSLLLINFGDFGSGHQSLYPFTQDAYPRKIHFLALGYNFHHLHACTQDNQKI